MIRKKRATSKKHDDCLIRMIRVAMGMTTEELAQLSGIEYSTVHRAEIGRVIRPEAIKKIASIMKISPDIVCYSTGQIPDETIDLIKKDPLFFKELVDGAYADPSRLTKTKEYMEDLKTKMKVINPEIDKMLSRIKPTE